MITKKGLRRLHREHVKMYAGKSKYTHIEKDMGYRYGLPGMPWRFQNGRPISMLVDEVIEQVFGKETTEK